MRVLRRLLGGLLGLVLLAIAGVYGITELRLRQRVQLPAAPPLAVSHDSTVVARGAHLAGSFAACVECHSPDLGGSVMIDDPAVGRIVASNLTTGAGGVLARYDDRALERALRHGIGPDGRKLIFMPAHEFAGLADDDVAALIAWVRTRPPVDRTLPTIRVGPVARALTLAGQFVLLPADKVDHAAPSRATAPSGTGVEHGRYIGAACTGCHGPQLSGGRIPGTPPDWKPAANITPAGLRNWSLADFTRAMREGRRPGGTAIDTLMPWRLYRTMSDEELTALYTYLSGVPSREYGMR